MQYLHSPLPYFQTYEVKILAGELLFYHNDKIIKSIGDEEFSEFNPEQLIDFVKTTANKISAIKVVTSYVYHGSANGIYRYHFIPRRIILNSD